MPKVNRIIVSRRHARRLRNATVNKLISREVAIVGSPDDFATNQTFLARNLIADSSSSSNYAAYNVDVNCPENYETLDNLSVNNDFALSDSPSKQGSSELEYNHMRIADVNNTEITATDTENTNPDSENADDSNIELCSSSANTCNTDSDDIPDDDKVVYSFSLNPSIFQKDLNNVLLKNNATQALTTDLLKFLKPLLPFLPVDARTLLETPKNTETIKLRNGEMCYFSIEACLRRELDGYVLEKGHVIELDFNIDGLPLFKSSSTEFWPILGRICSIRDQKPFAVAIFCGQGKPDPIDEYLQDFIVEMQLLLDNGIELKTGTHSVKIRCFSCDAPARSWLKCIKSHTAIAGCERCKILATSRDRRLFYPNTYGYRARKDEDFRNPKNHNCPQPNKNTARGKRRQQRKHILGMSPLLWIKYIGLVSQFILDPMHLVFLGVMKRLLLKYWVDGKRPFKLSKKHVKIADEVIRIIRSYIPSDFARKSRSFIEIKRWKATEFRLFLLYTGPVIMKGVLDKKKYNHFILLHVAITILSRSNQTNELLEFARAVLVKFVKKSVKNYEDEFVVYNVHSLPHIVDDVKKYGPLDTYSCFPFENYLKTLKMRVRSKKQPLQQISNRIFELNAMRKIEKDAAFQHKPSGITLTKGQGKEQYFECSSVQYGRLKLSSKTPDNVVSIHGDIYVIEKICCIHGEYKCIASPFKFKHDLYKKPLKSSQLDIFYVRSLSQPSIFSLNDVLHKCCMFPFREGFAIFPVIHHTS